MSLDTCKFTFPLKQSLHDKSWSQDDTTDKKWTFEHEVEKASSYRRPFLRTCPLLHVNQRKKYPRHAVAVLYSPQKCLTQLKMHSS